jgi:hypothetical protein
LYDAAKVHWSVEDTSPALGVCNYAVVGGRTATGAWLAVLDQLQAELERDGGGR